MEVQLAYAIGVAEPVSVMADTFGTGTIPNHQITELIRAFFKLTPRVIERSIFGGRSISRLPRTAISAEPARVLHGSAPIRPTPSARRPHRAVRRGVSRLVSRPNKIKGSL